MRSEYFKKLEEHYTEQDTEKKGRLPKKDLIKGWRP